MDGVVADVERFDAAGVVHRVQPPVKDEDGQRGEAAQPVDGCHATVALRVGATAVVATSGACMRQPMLPGGPRELRRMRRWLACTHRSKRWLEHANEVLRGAGLRASAGRTAVVDLLGRRAAC